MVSAGLRRAAGAALVTAAVAALPASASAETLTCRMGGAGSFAPSMQFVGGSGYYELATPDGLLGETLCSSGGGPWVPSTVSSRGLFVTIVCGTAVFTSPARTTDTTQIDVGGDGIVEVSRLDYRLDTRGWQGALQVSAVNGRTEHDPAFADGVLSLRPQHACTVMPVARFTVDGVFTLSW
jgi:hypothetical protein